MTGLTFLPASVSILALAATTLGNTSAYACRAAGFPDTYPWSASPVCSKEPTNAADARLRAFTFPDPSASNDGPNGNSTRASTHHSPSNIFTDLGIRRH